VQLDDHFASPGEVGGTTEKMTSSAKIILANNPKKVVLSPSTLDFSRVNLNVDWEEVFKCTLLRFIEVLSMLFKMNSI
jgi:hypothetical protein